MGEDIYLWNERGRELAKDRMRVTGIRERIEVEDILKSIKKTAMAKGR